MSTAVVNTRPNPAFTAVPQLAQPFLQMIADGSTQLQRAVNRIAGGPDIAAGRHIQTCDFCALKKRRISTGTAFSHNTVNSDVVSTIARKYGVLPQPRISAVVFLCGRIITYLYAKGGAFALDLVNFDCIARIIGNIAVDAGDTLPAP